MSYHDAVGLMLAVIIGTVVLIWYSWCWWTMLFYCRKPSEFFCEYYSTSSVFALANFILLILGGAWIITKIT